ncbi:hypothetical protein Tsubulata_015321 [Turnera subulata]|uniref:peroxidase n=1 Tax=Turnera subulata TaxID=218843 RepID=A0A9Q0FQ77_9ROSI|nr:hypothetical protein Tsubulata_015321 [Turnera subulata]
MMMMGHGSYGHGGSSPCSSNLSALAPPFTVTATGAKPVTNPLLVDLNEPNYTVTISPSLHNWVSHGPHPHNSEPDYFPVPNSDFGPIPSSNGYGYSPIPIHVPPSNPLASASADAGLYGSLFEAEPYYPSYVSPALGDDGPHKSGYDLLSTSHVAPSNGSSHDDYAHNVPGLEHMNHWGIGSGWWEALPDWQQSEPVKLDESYCSKESYTNQGISKYEAASHIIDMVGTETCMEAGSAGKLDYNSFLDENLKFGPSTYATTSNTKATSDSYSLAPSLKAVNYKSQKIPLVNSYDKSLRRHDESPNDSTAAIRSLPPVIIRAPEKESCSFKNTIDGDDKCLRRHDGSPNDNAALSRSLPPVVIGVPSQDSCSFENINDKNNKEFAGNNSALVKEPQPYKGSALNFHLEQNHHVEEHPRSNIPAVDSVQQSFRATTELKYPRTNLDSSNQAGCGSEAFIPIENSSESLDHYNPSVDSPCWKGAPFTHWSTYQASEVVTPQNTRKIGAFNGMNDRGPQSFSLAFKDGVELSPEKESENSLPHYDRSLDYSLGSSFEKHSFGRNMLYKEGLNDDVKFGQHLMKPRHDIHEPGKENMLSHKSIPTCDFKHLHSEQRSLDEGKRTSGKTFAPRDYVADDKKNINDEADGCSSHVPFHAIEHVLCSPPSAEDALFKITNSDVSMPKRYSQMLVNTMHNLSELLRFHCSNDACELKEEDCEVLKNVINNLTTCIERKVEKMGPTQESLYPQSINSLGRLPELRKDNKTRVLRVDAAKCQDQLECQQVQEAGNMTHKNEKFSKFAIMGDAADLVKEDKMTQAIKKVLAENFQDVEETQPQMLLYKNLWLEAEASLCLLNSTARFNRMKMEIENYNLPKENDLPENTAAMENFSRSKVISDMFSTSRIDVAVNKNGPLLYSSVPDSSLSAASGHSDDVMARFHILKSRVDNTSSANTCATEKLPGSKFSTESQIDKLAHEAKDTEAKKEALIPSLGIVNSTACCEKIETENCDVPKANENTVFMEDLQSSKVISDLSSTSTIKEAGNKNDPLSDSSIPGSYLAAAIRHFDDFRLFGSDILNSRVDKNGTGNAADKLSGSKFSTESQIDKLAHEAMDTAVKQGTPIQDFSMSSTTSLTNNIDASVLARFNILKRRDDNSSDVDMERNQLEGIDFVNAVPRTLSPIGKGGLKDKIFDVSMESVLQSSDSNSDEFKSPVKEFHLFVNDDPVAQPRTTCGLGDHLHAVLCCQNVSPQLQVGFYGNSCNLAELVVKKAVRDAFIKDRGIAAGLVRLHFHDCFVRGCDGSVLIDSTPTNKAEKDSPIPSLRGFEVIDDAKARLEAIAQCKGIVSCADILAFAARDSIEITGGLGYDVPAGRRDGRVSLASETLTNLPPPTFNVTQLTQSFANKGFTQEEMVTLSGAHTIGRAHCSSFSSRLYSFNNVTNAQDPSLDASYAASLKQLCPKGSPNLVVPMNPSSPTNTDVGYYADVLANRGLFSSDQILLTNAQTARQVKMNANNPMIWKHNFAAAMVKVGQIGVLTGNAGEIRAKCRVING